MVEESVEGTRGHVRNFWVLLGLSIVTLTIYYFYWLYINLKEIEEGVVLNEEAPFVRTARGLFWAKIGILAVTIVGSIIITLPPALADPYNIEVPSMIVLFPVISFVVNVVFFYFFAASISLGQRRVQLASFHVMGLYVLYLISSLFELIGSIVVLRGDTISTLSSIHTWSSIPSLSALASFSLLSFLDTLGNILWLVCIFLIQKEINRIWLEGKFAKG